MISRKAAAPSRQPLDRISGKALYREQGRFDSGLCGPAPAGGRGPAPGGMFWYAPARGSVLPLKAAAVAYETVR